jgi:hypothetical protein
MATYHPPGLPNEMPGKASNTRWAAQRLWSFIEKEGLREDRVIFTVADADSDFHPVYFEALTYRVSCTVRRNRSSRARKYEKGKQGKMRASSQGCFCSRARLDSPLSCSPSPPTG